MLRMNALLEKDRVLVSEIPGTTRDVVHDEIYLDNILVKFLDTAGIRYSGDHLEQEGVKRAKKLYREADVILMVFDLSAPFSEEDQYLLQMAKKQPNKIIFVGNKIDLGKSSENSGFINNDFIEISAKKKKNIKKIKEAIKRKIHYSPTNELFLNNERQYKKLKEIQKAIKSARKALKEQIGHEFVSMELRQVIDILSELTGDVTNEDILNNIFSQFCIGK
jgi:tRNA modification GTPase